MAVLTAVVIGVAAVGACVLVVHNIRAKLNREKYIRAYMFPAGVFEKFAQARPGLDVKNQQLVARALRQFFLAYLKSGCKRVAMPSQVVDDLWHEFILFTRVYRAFCDYAFGRFLHHSPAVKMGPVMSDNEGLRRVWWYCCLEENINPKKATRLPLLFALDRKLGIANGFVYDLQCRRQRAAEGGAIAAGGCGGAGSDRRDVNCADDFSDASIDGTTAGLGCSSGDGGAGGSGGGGDGGGAGCGGGCGGGS